MDVKKIKVIFLHPYFQGGGVEKSILRLSPALFESGIAQEIITINSTNAYKAKINELGIEFSDLGKMRLLSAIPLIIKKIKNDCNNYEKVILVGFQSYVNVVSVAIKLLVRKRNLKVILLERLYRDIVGGRLKNFIQPALMRMTYRFSDKVIANSTALAVATIKVSGVECAVMFNPTLDDSIISQSKENIDNEWLSGDYKVIIAVGRLEKVKDYPTLIKAFKLSASKESNLRLIIIGDGAERENLEQLCSQLQISNKVQFLGFQSNPYKYISRADIFVLSSLYEGLPNTLIEAVICGVPAISTDCKTGPDDILLNGEGGVLVPVGGIDKLSMAIDNYLEDPEYALTLHKKAYAALGRFEQKKVGKEFLNTVLSC